MLEEGLAAGVGGEEGGGEEPAGRSHGEDETALARDHAGSDGLGDLECGHAVDGDDVVHLLSSCFYERNGDAVALSNVVDQDADVQSVDELSQRGIVAVLVLGKVHCQGLGGDLRSIFGGDVGGESVELGLGARHKEEVVAFCGKRKGELFADAITGAGDESP